MPYALPEPADPPAHCLRANAAHPLGHVARIAHTMGQAEDTLALEASDDDGEPIVVDAEGQVVARSAAEICRALMPSWFPESPDHAQAVGKVRRLLDDVDTLRTLDDQGAYEAAHTAWAEQLQAVEARLAGQRFFGGHPEPTFADVLLFAVAVRIDPVYYELHKASSHLLRDLPSLHGFVRDLYELPAVYGTTDFDRIRRWAYGRAPVLNPKGIVPMGGIPRLHHPHGRAEDFAQTGSAATEEDPAKRRLAGEWVRPHSKHRDWIAADGSTRYPAESGRYHLYAPYNCPWSHRALLGRSVKGLSEVVGATVVYFRRDPDRGWQINPRIPGCTADEGSGVRYIEELYAKVGSTERSVPVLWDTQTGTMVSNESAEILRMFDRAFGDLATSDRVLVPDAHREAIDRMNALVYQRVNNGAYKAGFASSQAAYERAAARYFATLDWLNDRLAHQDWLVGSDELTEADLRLFPTVFRHDAVYFSRFKLNERRIRDLPALQRWLDRMLDVPAIAQASNLDHARNGYFGRTGNEVVPAGPVPLGLSRKDWSDEVWLNH